MATIIPFEDNRLAKQKQTLNQIRSTAKKTKKHLFFSRDELSRLMGLYSQMVALGHWRDYAIDQLQGQAVFSVFRHAYEAPLYMVSKQTTPNGKGREFVLYQGVQRLKRTASLEELIASLQTHAMP